jgi:hypothetical protein
VQARCTVNSSPGAVLELRAEPRGHRFSFLCGDRVQSPTIQVNNDDDDCVIVEQPLTSDDAEEAPGPQVLSARKLAMRSGRTPEPTIGGGDCLFQAVTSEARRVGLLIGKPRNLANSFWRRAAADCARQDFVQRLMTDHPQGEWRFGRSQAAPQTASYPDFILSPGQWAGTRTDSDWMVRALGVRAFPSASVAREGIFFWKAVSLITLCREGPYWPEGRHRARGEGGESQVGPNQAAWH